MLIHEGGGWGMTLIGALQNQSISMTKVTRLPQTLHIYNPQPRIIQVRS